MSEYEEEYEEEEEYQEPGTTGGRVAAKEAQLTYKQIQQEAYAVQQQAGQAGYIDETRQAPEGEHSPDHSPDTPEEIEDLNPGEAPTYTGPKTPDGWETVGEGDYGEGQPELIHKRSEESE